MARYSSAYSELVRRLEEIESIVAMAKDIARMRPIPSNLTRVNALCRGGIVLLCSHLEGYVEDLGTLAVTRMGEKALPKESMSPAFKYHLSRDLIDDINRTTEPSAIASRVGVFLNRDGTIWDNSPNFSFPLPVDTFIGNFATPRHDNIRRFFGRFGYDQYHNQLASELQGNFIPCMNMVNHVVDQRNKIAHGNFVTAGTPSDLQKMSGLVSLYCRSTDRVVGNWFRNIGCPIR